MKVNSVVSKPGRSLAIYLEKDGDIGQAPDLVISHEDILFLQRLGREIATQDGAEEGRGATHITARPIYTLNERPFRSRRIRRGPPGAASFVRSDLESYMRADAHNLARPELFVASMPERMPRMVALRELLIRISGEQSCE